MLRLSCPLVCFTCLPPATTTHFPYNSSILTRLLLTYYLTRALLQLLAQALLGFLDKDHNGVLEGGALRSTRVFYPLVPSYYNTLSP